MRSESGESGEGGESGSFVSMNDIILYVVRLFFPIILTLTIVIYIYYFGKIKKRTWKIYILLVAPILLSVIVTIIYYAPKPRYYYFLSILYDDKPISTGFSHKLGNKWPFLGSAAVELDNKRYIFLGGGEGQKDALLFYDVGKSKFIDVIDKTNINSTKATFSAVSFDMDKDGKNDLVVGREDGVYLYKNLGGLKFKKIKLKKQSDKVPLAISISDYDKDGNPDVYISNFTPVAKYKGSVFNDPSHNRSNVLLKGTGKGWKDVTIKTKSGGKSNTFTSAWVDLNKDSYPDLVLAHDSSEIQILENVKGQYFKSHIIPGKGNWMGLGIGDYDNDMDQDLFFTNVGKDIERDRLSLGDIKNGQKQVFAHAFLRNDGKFKYVDIIGDKSGVSGDGFGWGAMFGDTDLDGKLDLMFSENFILNPRYWIFPGISYHYQNKGNKMERKIKYKNPHFGQTPLLADIDNDNKQDVIWVNQYGDSIAHLNKSENSYLNVKLPETTEFVNAKVILHTNTSKQYREVIQGGDGFGSNSSNVVQFGLGKNPYIKLHKVEVVTLTGDKYEVLNPKSNSTITLNILNKIKI